MEEENIVICEKCYEENELTRDTCKNCGAKLYKNNIEIKGITPTTSKVNNARDNKNISEDNIDEDTDEDTDEDMRDEIYNVKTIVGITGVVGFVVSIILPFISIELIGLSFLGFIITPIVMAITSSILKKMNIETYFLRYKRFIKKSGMKNCKSVSYKNIVGLDIDTKAQLLSAYSYYENVSTILQFDEVLDFEVIENGNSVVSSRSGSTVVGGLLFGGLGAIAGASGSRTINNTCTMLKLNIYTSNAQYSVVTIDFLECSIPKNSSLYNYLTEIINKMISFLKIAREHNRQKERKEDRKVIIENAEEIRKDNSNNSDLSKLKELAELKESGVITEKDFEKAKQKILNKI